MFAVNSFVELVEYMYIFKIPGVNVFLSERLSQDPLEKFFGCIRQRGKSHENPNMQQFCKGSQALRIINGTCGFVSKGNCRGNKTSVDWEKENRPLPRRKRLRLVSTHITSSNGNENSQPSDQIDVRGTSRKPGDAQEQTGMQEQRVTQEQVDTREQGDTQEEGMRKQRVTQEQGETREQRGTQEQRETREQGDTREQSMQEQIVKQEQVETREQGDTQEQSMQEQIVKQEQGDTQEQSMQEQGETREQEET